MNHFCKMSKYGDEDDYIREVFKFPCFFCNETDFKLTNL